MSEPDIVNTVAMDNALQAKKDILSLDHHIKELADEGKLKVVAALYDIRTGRVEWVE